MRILALDTATEACSVALLTGQEVLGRRAEVAKGHAEQILAMVDALLAESGISLAMLDGIAASIGPGAFTGVRISVAVAQGLCFGANLPVVPVTTLEALALQAMSGGSDRVLACLDARMGEVYWGCFAGDAADTLIACGAARVGPAAEVEFPGAASYGGIGRGFAAYPQLAALAGLTRLQAQALPDAREMARIGAVRLAAGSGLDPADLRPQYLRDKVALTSEERAAQARPARREPP